MEINRKVVLTQLTRFLKDKIAPEEIYQWALEVAITKEYERISIDDPLVRQIILDLIDLNHDDANKIPPRFTFEYYQDCLRGRQQFDPSKIGQIGKLHEKDDDEKEREVAVKRLLRRDTINEIFIFFRIYIILFGLCSLAIHLFAIYKPHFLQFGEIDPSRLETAYESLPHILYASFVLIPQSYTAKGILFYLSFPILVFGLLFYWFVTGLIIMKLSLNFIFILVILPFSAVPPTLALLLLILSREEARKKFRMKPNMIIFLSLLLAFSPLSCGGMSSQEITADGKTADGEKFLNGSFHQNDNKGTLIRKGVMSEGKYNGKIKEYYDTGELKFEFIYKNGIRHGKAKEFYKNGEVKSEFFYQGGQLSGEIKTFYDYGGLKSRENYYMGVADGLTEKFDAYERLIEEVTYQNGQIVGKLRTFYENGRVYTELEYVEGAANGIYREYYPTGELKRISNYVNDTQQGMIRDFYANGQLEREWQASNGVSNGESTWYERNGALKSKGFYKDGQPHGEFKVYKNGRISHIDYYSNGRIYNRKIYDEKGNLQYEQSLM